MSDLYGVLPPLPSNFSGGSTGSGEFSLSALQGDLEQMNSGAVPVLPGESSSSPLTFSSAVQNLSQLGSGLNSGSTTTSSSTGSGSSSITSFTADSLIGRVLFFLLGIIFMAGAIYTYKK
jgi:hypothetical protein